MPLSSPNPAPNHHMIVPHALAGFKPINKNKVGPPRSAVANAGGTTTTILVPDADATDLFVGDRVRLFTSANAIKENKLFTITVKGSAAGTTTFTFTPAAAVATASGDYISTTQDISEVTNISNYSDFASIDARLNVLNPSLYTQARLNTMTLNDKLSALKQADDPELG